MHLFVLFLGLLWAATTFFVMAKQFTKPAGRSADDTRNFLAGKYVSAITIFHTLSLTPSPTGHTVPKEKEGRRGRR
jgi:hypothetical protein